VALAADPGADLALGLRSGKAIALLQPGGELIAAAVDAGDVSSVSLAQLCRSLPLKCSQLPSI